jgi:hypothetical protein
MKIDNVAMFFRYISVKAKVYPCLYQSFVFFGTRAYQKYQYELSFYDMT